MGRVQQFSEPTYYRTINKGDYTTTQYGKGVFGNSYCGQWQLQNKESTRPVPPEIEPDMTARTGGTHAGRFTASAPDPTTTASLPSNKGGCGASDRGLLGEGPVVLSSPPNQQARYPSAAGPGTWSQLQRWLGTPRALG